MHFNALIPEDFDKVAEIFAGTIRHYNKGWGNGHEWGIKYWEIWNEPDGNNTMWCLPDGDLGVGETEDERKAVLVADYRSGSAEDISVEVAGVLADAKASAWVHEGGEVRHCPVRRQIIA